METNTRTKLVIWHRWFGVFAALWLALMGITGTIIVFYGELDTWLNSDLRTTQNTGTMMPIDQILTAAESSHPGSTVYFVNVPNKPRETAQVFLFFPDTDKNRLNVFVDPYTSQVLGEREIGVVNFNRRYVMNLIYELHMDLLLGNWMLGFLGLVSFLWLIDHLMVLWISFPVAKNWVWSFLIRRGTSGVKFHYDVHRAFGLWFFPVTLVLAMSGLFFTWNPIFEAVVNQISPTKPRHIYTMNEHSEPLYEPLITFNTAVNTAQLRAGREVDIINYYPYLQAYMARAFDERDVDPHARRLITIDANSGDILDDAHAASGSAGDVFLMWQYPLHSGKAFGWTGRIIIFLSGIILTILCTTGLVIWWRKLKARKGI